MARPDGWRDDELLALLQQLRKNMTEYIYSNDEAFARSIQHAFQDKTTRDIMEVVRELMDGLSFSMKTRKFTNEALVVEGNCVYPHEYLYETMILQPENRQGGVWDPDELRSALRKMETYRHFFDDNPELYFARVQIWSKTVPDVRTKFYLWRDIYVDESSNATATESMGADINLKRVECLRKIFDDVPPAPSPEPPTPSPISPGTGGGGRVFSPVAVTASTGKPPKVRMWSPDDLESFVQLLVEVTQDLQTKGTSPLVQEIAVRLNRSEPSLLGKVQDIRMRFEKRTAYHRAAEIPSIIYDEASIAHKIFTSDWSDSSDPYSLAIFALKDLQNRALKRLKTRGRQPRPPPLQMEMRQRAPSTLASPGEAATAATETTTPKITDIAQQLKPQIHPIVKTVGSNSTTDSNESKPPSVLKASSPTPTPTPTPTYSEFVRDCAAMIKWTEPRTHALCSTIQTALPTYTTTPRSEFYSQVAEAMGGAFDAPGIYFRGERILRLCERRYGSLDCFAAAVEGSGESTETPAAPQICNSPAVTKASVSHDITIPGASETPITHTPEAVAVASPPATAEASTATELSVAATTTRYGETRAFGKSNKTTKQAFQQKVETTRVVGTATDHTESSPSVQYCSPEHYEYEYDAAESGAVAATGPDKLLDDNEGDGGLGAVARGGERDDDNGDNDGDVDTQSLDLSDAASDASSDYGHDNHVAVHARHAHKRYHLHAHTHRDAASGKVQVSSHKMLVVEQTPQPCYCKDCGRKVRRRQSSPLRETAVASIHRKRSRSELYAEHGRWVEDRRAVHEVAHHHVHHRRSGERYHDDTDSHEEMIDARATTELDGMWAALLAPIETGISELETKRREQRERAADRDEQAHQKHWKKELRQHVRDEWRVEAVAATGKTVMVAPSLNGRGSSM